MKGSSVEWIDKIPKLWKVKKLKHLVSYNDDTLGANTNPDYEFHYIEISDVDYIDGIKINEKIRFEDSPSRARRVVRPHDVIVSTVRTYLRAIGVFPDIKDGVCSTGFCVLRGNIEELDQEFLSYSVRSEWFISEVIGNSYGVSYPAINSSELVELKIAVPPKEEQKLISRYLGKKTEQIDSLIEKIQKKIKFLKEQRTSLINQCVTKGLDANIEMKDSGVEWIGEIPKHWEVHKLKYLSSATLSSVDRHEYETERRVSICHYPDVYYNEFIDRQTILPFGTCNDKELEKFSLRRGDILLTKDSETPDDIGVPTYVRELIENTVCGYHLARVRVLSKTISSLFLYRFIQSSSVGNYFSISANGITRFGLGKESIESLVVLVPPLSEQEEITSLLNTQSLLTQQLIKKYKQLTELLKEFHQSLISSVVTGQVRVTEDMI